MADDDADCVTVLEYVLANEGATVRTATSASEVLAILRTWTPDVLLLDISMPDMSGHELLTVIRRQPALREIPAVAVSGYSYEREKQRSIAAGFVGHIDQPIDVATLVELITLLTPRPHAA
jgi:CheY-like chemotaxis protein